jgi:hypothetical protein
MHLAEWDLIISLSHLLALDGGIILIVICITKSIVTCTQHSYLQRYILVEIIGILKENNFLLFARLSSHYEECCFLGGSDAG